MSGSPTIDLYCNEATSEVVSSDSNNIIANYESDAGFDVLWDSDKESHLLSLLDSELVQVQEKIHSLGQLRKKTCLKTAREEAINWILKVHAYYNFRPETAYLSVNYLDRFLLSHTLQQEKGWPLQLLSVACLALAAKMEETKVPFLLDLQIMEPAFLFKPKTVQRMELLVMATLKWRLRTITPFDFAHLFIAKLSCSLGADFNYVVSCVSDIIIKTCLGMDFLEFPPSTIAAATLLWVTDQYVHDQKLLECFHKNICIDMVQKCFKLMKQSIHRSQHFWPKTLQLMPLSPTCVLDHAALSESSNAPKP